MGGWGKRVGASGMGLTKKRELYLHFPSPRPSTTCSFMPSSEVK